jgi:succinate dehydrogenase/fumarate reductase-like Fe-S protein
MSHILQAESNQEPEIGAPVIVDIYRSDPSEDPEGEYQRYVVPYKRRMSVLTMLREVYESIDPTLAFRNQQCGRGICGCCRVKVDGKVSKACETLLAPGARVIVSPYRGTKVIRDLVVSS